MHSKSNPLYVCSFYYGSRLTFKEGMAPNGPLCRLARSIVYSNYVVFMQLSIFTICDRILENRPFRHKNWNPSFACHVQAHSCTIQKHQALDSRLPGLLLQTAFFTDGVKPWGCISWSWGHINRTACGTKLLLMAVLASLVDCISSCHLLKAQHCFLGLNWYFTPPWLPTHSHHPLNPPPTHPPPL